MSSMMLFDFVENGEAKFIPTQVLKSKFGEHFIQRGEFYNLHYAKNEEAEIYGEFEEPTINSFSISRFGPDKRLWKAVIEILQMEGTLLISPEQKGIIVGNPNTPKHIPEELSQHFPRVIFATSGEEVVKLITGR